MRNYAKRPPQRSGEPLAVAREGNGGWHARDADGNLVAVHEYRNDLVPGLRNEGFDPRVVGEPR